MNNKNTDKEFFDLADEIDEAKLSEIIEREDIPDADKVSADTIKGIKNRTWQKLGMLNQSEQPEAKKAVNPRRRTTIWKPGIAAACILVLLITSFNYKIVFAEVKKLLVFIPGINRVIDNQGETVYVLPGPLKLQSGQGELTVASVHMDSNKASITMWGKKTAVPKAVFFVDGAGKEYEASSFNVWSSSAWQGTYTYKGNIGGPADLSVVIKDLDGLKIKLQLEAAEGFESLEKMGSTSQANGMNITVIPEIEQNKLKLNFLTPVENGAMLVSYADYGEAMTLSDTAGNLYDLWKPDTGFLSRDICYFDTNGRFDKAMKLNVPYLELELNNQDARNTVKIDIPSQGKAAINKKTELAGFPLTITAAERIDSKTIRIYTDTGYNNKDLRALKQFSIGNISTKVLGAGLLAGQWKKEGAAFGAISERIELSHSMKFNEENGAAEYFEIGVEPDAESIILLMYRPLVEVRGPWEFDIGSVK